MKKILAISLVLVCLLSVCASAAEFKDMPSDWSTEALEAAVKNGLLTGNDGYIKASDNMTRAEMATIMVRACGAVRTADISAFKDVKAEDWFSDAMSKAVAMGAFKGSGDKLNPNSPITRQEAFVVLSRVFGMAVSMKVDTSVLDAFKDAAKIADWAKTDIAAIVANGYVSGDNGQINPLNNISRAEFAVVMDRIIKYYIDDPEAELPVDGNVMIRTKGVDLSGFKTDKLVVLGDAVGAEDLAIKDAELTGVFALRSGKDVYITGTYNQVVMLCPGIKLAPIGAKISGVYVCDGSVFDATENKIGIGK